MKKITLLQFSPQIIELIPYLGFSKNYILDQTIIYAQLLCSLGSNSVIKNQYSQFLSQPIVLLFNGINFHYKSFSSWQNKNSNCFKKMKNKSYVKLLSKLRS